MLNGLVEDPNSRINTAVLKVYSVERLETWNHFSKPAEAPVAQLEGGSETEWKYLEGNDKLNSTAGKDNIAAEPRELIIRALLSCMPINKLLVFP
jgi:hypothetical protein